jgi:transglutaminase-like putative cysteine protease
MNDTLRSTAHLDADHPAVVGFARSVVEDRPPVAAAVALFYAVRDGWWYNPWNVSLVPEGYRASLVLARQPRQGHCIDKAMLLAASCRAVGIPARLHFADVRNHVGTARLEEKLGTDLLVFHGYVELWLADRWVKATPAFNLELCEKLGVVPLEFDGRHDAVFQAYDRSAGRFMEIVTDHGVFDDLPFDAMMAAWKVHYAPVARGVWPINEGGR